MSNISFQKDGFIGIFDNVYEDQYITDLLAFFNAQENIKFIEETKNRTEKHLRDMDELYLADPLTIHHVPAMFSNHFFGKLWNDVYPVYKKEFSILSELQMQGEGLKIKKIKPGGGFHNWHFESEGKSSDRKLVVQLYLNDIDEAGETEFLYQNKRISPKKNRLLLWPADWTHTHRGNPVIGNTDKYILTTWLQEIVKGN
jgi:hypothetical protein